MPEGAGGEVMEHQALGLEMARGKLLLDTILAGQEPLHGGIAIVLRDSAIPNISAMVAHTTANQKMTLSTR